MIQNRITNIVFVVGWFIVLLAIALLISIIFFFATVSFLEPISRFIISFLLNIGLTYLFVRFWDVSRSARLFFIVVPPVICLLLFVALGIIQNSN